MRISFPGRRELERQREMLSITEAGPLGSYVQPGMEKEPETQLGYWGVGASGPEFRTSEQESGTASLVRYVVEVARGPKPLREGGRTSRSKDGGFQRAQLTQGPVGQGHGA